MNKYLLLTLSLFVFGFSQDQEYIDVLELHNGDIIKGKIIEILKDNYVRIELQGGSILTYQYSEIRTINQEEVRFSTSRDDYGFASLYFLIMLLFTFTLVVYS